MKKILFGMTAWGNHLDLFLKYGMPSLMAEGNWPTLAKEYEILLALHSNSGGYKKLMKVLPDYINICAYGDVSNGDKYEQLGHHQNSDLGLAKALGASYHCLMPDYIYSDKCFEGVLKVVERGHKAIVRLVVSTVAETILSELDRPRSAIDLATLSLEHIHQGIRNWRITDRGYPKTHVIAYIGKDTLTMCSPHCSPVYIANEAIHITGSKLPIDCILDRAIIGEIYCPKPEDGIVVIEVSPLAAREPQYECVNLAEFCRCFKWDTQNSARQLYIFELETVDAIHTQDNCWDNKDIENMKKTVHDALVSNMEKQDA